MLYFDPNNAQDAALLHESVRFHTEGREIAAAAEKDVVARYTDRVDLYRHRYLTDPASSIYTYSEGGQLYGVFLDGFDPSPENASGYAADRRDWTGLADALRRSIALVTSHRLRHYDDNPGMKRERIDGYEYERFRERDMEWPLGWDRLLLQYDRRETAYV